MFSSGVTWEQCPDHAVRFPLGAMCPRCAQEHKARQSLASRVDWKEIVPVPDQFDFMKLEQVYCRDEEYEFYSYKGDDLNEKEKLRTLVLEKRAEFLDHYLKTVACLEKRLDILERYNKMKTEEPTDVHKPKDRN